MVEITTHDNTVVVYDEKGVAKTVGPDSVNVFELAQGAFCTISVPVNIEEGEHPDNTLPGEQPYPDQDLPAFVEKMIKFWQDFFTKIKNRPKPTPAKK
jgi:hypothetical protein